MCDESMTLGPSISDNDTVEDYINSMTSTDISSVFIGTGAPNPLIVLLMSF